MAANAHKPSWNTAAEILAGVLSRLPSAKRLHEYRVWEVWESTVGTAISRRAQPQRLQDGKLFVTVSNSAWMQELQFAKIMIKDKLNQQLGAGVIKDIFFMLGRVSRVVELPTQPSHRPVPLSAEDLMVPSLGHPDIEAALVSLLEARKRRLLRDEDEN